MGFGVSAQGLHQTNREDIFDLSKVGQTAVRIGEIGDAQLGGDLGAQGAVGFPRYRNERLFGDLAAICVVNERQVVNFVL